MIYPLLTTIFFLTGFIFLVAACDDANFKQWGAVFMDILLSVLSFIMAAIFFYLT